MAISADEMACFDPAIKVIEVKDGFINIQLELNTSVLTFNERELHLMTKLLQVTKSGS